MDAAVHVHLLASALYCGWSEIRSLCTATSLAQVALDVAVWGLQHIAHQCFAGQNAVRDAGGIEALVKVTPPACRRPRLVRRTDRLTQLLTCASWRLWREAAYMRHGHDHTRLRITGGGFQQPSARSSMVMHVC